MPSWDIGSSGRRAGRSVARWLGCGAIAAALAAQPAGKPAAPQGSSPTAPQPSTDLSTIVVPIHASLAPLVPQLEQQVPKEVRRLDAYEMEPNGQFGLKYRVLRDPIALNMAGGGLHATTTVHYGVEACRKTKRPFSDVTVMWPCVSCGYSEPMRDAFIAIHSHLEWDASWRIRTRTTARPAEFPRRCAVTFANVDITDWRIAPLVNQQLREVARTIDRNAPKLTSVRPTAQQIWSTLQTPAEIAPRTWLIMEPADVALAPITGSGLSVSSALVLRARMRVVVGDRPAVAAKPLPPLRTEAAANEGLRVPFDVELPFGEANRLLAENFSNQKFGATKIESLRIAPAANGRLAIETMVNYDGGLFKRYHGLVYLEATPLFDSATRTLSLQHLDYALDPKRKNPFVRVADRLAHGTLRDEIAKGARWSIAPQIATVRAEIEKAVNRPLAPNVIMRGKVDAIEPVSASVDAAGMLVRVVAAGRVEVEAR
jgi:hypothetical protein